MPTQHREVLLTVRQDLGLATEERKLMSLFKLYNPTPNQAKERYDVPSFASIALVTLKSKEQDKVVPVSGK